MKVFLPLYITVAVVGTVAIYLWGPRFRRSSPAPVSPRVLVPQVGSAVVHSSSSSSSPSEAVEDLLPPAYYDIRPVAKGDSVTWGVTAQEARLYGPHGEGLARLKGGVFIRFVKWTHSPTKGDLVACTLVDEPTPAQPYCLLLKKDLLLLSGDRSKLAASQLGALKKFYSLRGEYLVRKKALLQKEASKNPFFSRYQTLYQKLTAHAERARVLEERRQKESISELERERLMDQLARMRQEEGKVRREYDGIRAKYNQWKKENQHLDSIRSDATLQAHQKAMSACAPLIPGLMRWGLE